MSRPVDGRCARHAPGYTLVELSIALAILGILASVSGSQYLSYLDRARTARAIVEIRNIAAQIDPAGDEDASWPASLAAAGITTRDPWGNPYQYLLIEGDLPPGMARAGGSLPSVAAPPSGAGAGAGAPSDAGTGGSGADPGTGQGGFADGTNPGSGAAGGGAASGGNGSAGGGPPAIALARKDRFQVPINSDFDLYSMGPDGESQAPLNAPVSRDDVIRANDGAFYGVAEDF